FSVGVMLYEVFNGHRPIDEAARTRSRARRVAALEEAAPLPAWVPPDLAALVHNLLQPDPESRPSARQVLEGLGASTPRPSVPVAAAPGRAFVGRQPELTALFEAYRANISGTPIAVLVSGASGMGKTALVRHFLDELSRDRSGPLVLAGRCYEQEAVPYK